MSAADVGTNVPTHEAVARIVAEAPPLPAEAAALLRSTGLRPREVAR